MNVSNSMTDAGQDVPHAGHRLLPLNTDLQDELRLCFRFQNIHSVLATANQEEQDDSTYDTDHCKDN